MMNFPNTMDVLDQFGQAFVNEYRSLLEQDNNTTGELYRTINYRVSTGSSAWIVSINLADYWKWAEHGRGPGKMPPKAPIDRWIQAKRILPQPYMLKSGKMVTPTIAQLSFLIRRKIGREGTDGHWYFQNTFDKVKADFMERLKEAIAKDIIENMGA